MNNKWIRQGDQIIALSGNEKGQSGKVLSRTNDRVIVEGLNLRKKHVKPKQRTQKGIIEIEGSMHISNVALCDDQKAPIKVKVTTNAEGQRQLVYLKDGKEVVYRKVKQKK